MVEEGWKKYRETSNETGLVKVVAAGRETITVKKNARPITKNQNEPVWGADHHGNGKLFCCFLLFWLLSWSPSITSTGS